MPKNIDGKPVNEEKWSKAKELAVEQGHSEDYDYVVEVYKKMVGLKSKNNYLFLSDPCGWHIVETKSGKKHFVEGYISTFDKDLYNDVVTHEGMSDMLNQLGERSIKLDLDHETWRDDNGRMYEHPKNLNPIGKIVDANLDSVGIKVRAEINGSSSRFGEVWKSIEDGFLDAFSVAYVPKESKSVDTEQGKVNLLDKVDLLNVALTGSPINPNAKMTDVFLKSLRDMEEKFKMENENKAKEVVVEAKAEIEAKPVEAPKEEVAEAPKEEASKEEPKPEAPKVDVEAELKSRDERIGSLEKEMAELKAKIAEPIMKSVVEQMPEVKEESNIKGPLDLIS